MKSCVSWLRGTPSPFCALLLVLPVSLACLLPSARAQQLPDPLAAAGPIQAGPLLPDPTPGELPPVHLRNRPALLDPEPVMNTPHVHVKRYRVGPAGSVHANNVTPTCKSPQLSYFGGPVISNVQAVAVFWNSDVNATIQSNMGQFFADLTVSPFMSVLSQYSTNGNNVSGGTDQWIGNGTSGGSYTLTPSKCLATNNVSECSLQDADIQNELNAQIAAGHLPEPTYDFDGNPNTVYMTFFPPEVSVSGPDGSGNSCVDGGFCAYHNTGTITGGSRPLIYGVLMDEFTSMCNEGCGGNSSDLENQTDAASHEFAESITDADIGLDIQNGYAKPGAWGDNSNNCGEVADICDSGGAGDTFTVSSRTWTVQEIWSNEQGKCESSGTETVPFALPGPGTQTAWTSFNLTLTAQNPVGGTNTHYAGRVHFTSSDPSATLPADYLFSPYSTTPGVYTFPATLVTGASQTITATDTLNPNLTVTTTVPLTHPAVSVTVGTNPAGLSFSVDSTAYTSPQSLSWTGGTSHSLSTTQQQSAGTGAMEEFQNWSDGGELSHSVTATPSTTAYTANFALYYDLTTAANLTAGGTASPASMYYPSAAVVNLSATANAGWTFLNWTGPVAKSTSAATTVTMSGPESVTANFIPNLVVTVTGDTAGNCTPQTAPPAGTDPSCSLRDALTTSAAAGGAKIYFSNAVFTGAATITLTNGTLTVPTNTTIFGLTTGSGTNLTNLVTVSGGNAVTVFTVNSGSTATIEALAVTGGAAVNGGGISNAGTLTLTNCTISGNKAMSTTSGVATGGGGIYNTGVIGISGCTISGNSAKAVGAAAIGGGIDNQYVVLMSDCTIAGNTVSAGGNGSGGGIYTTGSGPGVLQIDGGTITGNTSDAPGSGIYLSFLTVLENSIVAGNSPAGTDISVNGSLIDNNGNLIGVSGVNLAPLGNYGGPTQTMLPLPGSAAICAGTMANASGVSTDQRGFERIATYGGQPCVDAGADQTAYLLAFTTQPPANAIEGQALTPAPVVGLSENSNVGSYAASTVTMSDSAAELGGTLSGHLVSGSLKFSSLIFNGSASNDTLTATMELTSSLNLTASSLTEVTVQGVATLSSPAPNSVLMGPAVTFGWSAVSGATGYQLWIGKSGVNTNNVYSSGVVTGTSVMPLNLPLNGETLYVRLYTEISGTWYHFDYTYTAASPATLSAPAAGTLPGPVTTFTWTAPAGALAYQLWLGSTGVNSNNLFSSGLTHSNTTTRTNLPTNGETIYARVYTDFGGTWVHADYVFTAAQQSVPVSPAIGSTLAEPAQTFTWTTATGSSADANEFWIGSTGVASNDVYSSGILHVTSVTRTNMPTNGKTLYARLYTDYNGTWVHQDYTLTAAAESVMVSPAPGSTLSGANVTFSWSTATGGATQYQLWLGTTGVGSNNLYSTGATAATSVTRTNVPTLGQTIYARLYTNYNGTWVHTDYTYVEAP